MLGILLADQFLKNILSSNNKILLLIFLLLFCLILWRRKVFVLIVFVSFTILGWLRFESYNLTEKIPESLIYKELDLKLKIIDDFRSSENFYKYKAEVISIDTLDRKSTRLNSSHVAISYAVFCLKKKKNINHYI